MKLDDGSTYKRTDLLIVPPGSESTVHPVNAQKKENTLEKQRLNKEKEAAYKEKHPERAAQPRIRIEPVPPPPKPAPLLAIEDKKPAPKAAPKAAPLLAIEDKKSSTRLLSDAFKNYVPKKSKDEKVREFYDRKRAKDAEAKRLRDEKENERERKKVETKRIAALQKANKK